MATITTTASDFRMGDNSTTKTRQAGEAINAFQLVYLAADNKVYKAANSTTELANLTNGGMAATSASVDEPISIVTFNVNSYVDSASAIWVKGTTYVVSDTAGYMMDAGDAASGDAVTVVGVAASTTSLRLIGQSGVSGVVI